jgi:hypothetical protein
MVRRQDLTQGDRIWEPRHALTAYDAAYVSLAEALEVPVVTLRPATEPRHRPRRARRAVA